MKKSDIRSIVSALDALPLRECEDREMKIALIQDRVYLKRIAADIEGDISSLRSEIIGDKQEMVNAYFAAAQSKENDKAAELLPEVKDVILDFDRASSQMLGQEVDVKIPCRVSERALLDFVVDKAPDAVDVIDVLLLNLT